MDSGRLQPALFGGLFIGVLSALPIVNGGNCCCCLWVVAGGALAVYLRQQNSPYAVPSSEGALLGLMAGALGGIVAALISIPLMALMGPWQQQILDRAIANQDIPPEMRDLFQRAAVGATFGIAMAFVNIIIFSIFGMIGGLLGTVMFKKNAPPPPQGTMEVLPPE